MRLIVLVPLISLRLLFPSSFVLANSELRKSGKSQFIFKKFDTKKSLPPYSSREELDDIIDSDNNKYNRSNIHSNDLVSWGHLYLVSSQSGLSMRIISSNLRNLRFNMYTNYIF
jgi:hypothetical protein